MLPDLSAAGRLCMRAPVTGARRGGAAVEWGVPGERAMSSSHAGADGCARQDASDGGEGSALHLYIGLIGNQSKKH
jgi:hypothetical protein